MVSTHSRLKAAGVCHIIKTAFKQCFNTQPPEGGWVLGGARHPRAHVSTHSRLKAAGQRAAACGQPIGRFNTQPPEGGWAAGIMPEGMMIVSTHSRLKAAGVLVCAHAARHAVSTHSRLKAAGTDNLQEGLHKWRFNTQPPEGGWVSSFADYLMRNQNTMFQHTAA